MRQSVGIERLGRGLNAKVYSNVRPARRRTALLRKTGSLLLAHFG
jgi:hypothetical protein